MCAECAIFRDYSGYSSGQWEKTFHGNTFSRRLSTCSGSSLTKLHHLFILRIPRRTTPYNWRWTTWLFVSWSQPQYCSGWVHGQFWGAWSARFITRRQILFRFGRINNSYCSEERTSKCFTGSVWLGASGILPIHSSDFVGHLHVCAILVMLEIPD